MKYVNLLLLVVAVLLQSSCGLWRESGSNIYNTNVGNVGIGTSEPESKLTVVDESSLPIQGEISAVSSTINSPTNARAVYGAATNPASTWNYGGYFTAAGQSSGVFGEASDSDLGIAGGVFHSYGKRGKAVIGLALSEDATGNSYGGWFESRAAQGIGLYAKGGENGFAAQFNGKVQISGSGNSGSPPDDMLSVDGLIESTSGGIKFPDGSVQSTAALPLSPLITVRKLDFNIAPGTLEEKRIGCNDRELATGGGFRTEDDPKLYVWRNAPADDAKGWRVSLSNYGSSNRSVTAYAVCMRVG